MSLDPARRPTGPEVLERLGVAEAPAWGATAAASFTQTPPFVGRAQELQTLHEAFRHSERGQPTVLLVEGESGVGKTALARRFSEELQGRGVVVLTGRCYEREAVPFKAIDGVVDDLSRYMAHLPDRDAVALLPRAASLLADVFPMLRRVKAVARAPRPTGEARSDPHEQRTRLFAAVRELLARLGDRRPLMVVIDDLQWADADSLALLGEILRPPEAPTLLCLMLARTETPSEPGGVPEVERYLPPALRRLPLGRLPPADALELAALLLRHTAPTAGVSADAIVTEAGGHPLFIDELVRHVGLRAGAGSVSLRLDDALRSRVAALPPAALRLLEVVTVAARPAPLEVVAQAAGLGPVEFTRALGLLRVGNLVRAGRSRGVDTVGAYHDRVREAVAPLLEAGTRRAYHRELALAMEAGGHTDHETLAEHWRGAGERARAASLAAGAAEEAESAFAFDRAAKLYRMALELGLDATERAFPLRVRLGEVLANAGRGPEAAEQYLAAAAVAPPVEALELQRRAAEQHLRSGHIDEGLAAIGQVLRAVGMTLPPTPRRALVSLLWRRARIRLRGLRFRERHASEVAPEELSRLDICWSVASSLGVVDTIRGADFGGRALLLALRAGEPSRLIRALSTEAIYVSLPGRPAAARAARLAAMVSDLARQHDDPAARGWAEGCGGFTSYYVGAFRQALECLERSETLFRDGCRGVTWELDSVQLFLIWCLFYLGRFAETSRRVPQLVAAALDRGDLYAATNLRLGLINATWLVHDDSEEARRMAREASARWSRQGFHVQHWFELLAQTQLDLYCGQGRAAHARVAKRWAGLARSMLLRVQLVRIEALHLRARSALAALGDDASDRGGLLREAARAARRLAQERTPMAAALAALVRAGLAAAAGDTGAALTSLRTATGGFEAAEMPLQAAVARRRQGELVGGDEGRALIEAADAWMAEQKIKHPGRWSALVAPGFAA
jgi:tetratricopeptide (TPR) repeat protein